MHKQTIKTLGRITTLSLIILVCIRVATAFMEADSSVVENKYNFKSAGSSELGNVGVAVSTNIGIRFEQNKAKSTSQNTQLKLGNLSGDTLADREEVLSVNIVALRDYNNLMKTDVKELISSSSNPEQALDSYISQLELRYKNVIQNGKALESQLAKLEADMEAALAAVRVHKAEMAAGLKAHDTDAIMEAMDNYLIQTNNYNIAQSNRMFVRYFLNKHLEFTGTNQVLLDTLINNKAALSSGSFIVIPDSGADLLKDLNLILDENELKTGEPSSSGSPSGGLLIPNIISPTDGSAIFDPQPGEMTNLKQNVDRGIQMFDEIR